MRRLATLAAAVLLVAAPLAVAEGLRLLGDGERRPGLLAPGVGREDARPRRLRREEGRRPRLVPEGLHRRVNAGVQVAP